MPDAPSQSDALHCPGCGYNLFGIESTRCPECGIAIDRQILMQSQLPWAHRQSLGRVRAFFKTALIATFRPKQIAREMSGAVDAAGSRRFRLICMAAAWPVPIVALVVTTDAMESVSWTLVWVGTVFGVSVWFSLMVMMALPSLYLPHDLSDVLRERNEAHCDFAAAALIWAWFPAALGVAGTMLCNTFTYGNQWDRASLGRPLLISGMILGGLNLLLLVRSYATLVTHAGHTSSARGWLAFFTLPILWAAAAAIILTVFPLAVLFIAVFAYRVF